MSRFPLLLWLTCCMLLSACSKPPISPGAAAPDEPLQEKSDGKQWVFLDYKIQSVAHYEIKARVLGVKSYWHDLVPLDFALGWGRMSDPAVYSQIKFRQFARWYIYSWSNPPPIPPEEMQFSSANTHLIPSNPDILEQLQDIEVGQVVELKGQLVNLTPLKKGYYWPTSQTRTDNGNGACELMWVESVRVVP